MHQRLLTSPLWTQRLLCAQHLIRVSLKSRPAAPLPWRRLRVNIGEQLSYELTGLIEMKTWEVVLMTDMPDGSNLMNCHMLFSVKRNADGSIDKFKCRLVADGQTQRHGFCAVSLASEAPILFSRAITVVRPGEFEAPFSLMLPKGSVVVFQGNAGKLAEHCIPGVPAYRISITFRKIPEDVQKLLLAPKEQAMTKWDDDDEYGDDY